MSGMIRIVTALAIAALLPLSANAAELPVPKLHRVVAHRAHRHVYAPARHFGYYFGGWGRRSGGTASSWYGSTFVLAGSPWEGPAIVLKAGPKGVARIHCTERRPDACLAEPVLAGVAVAEPWVGR